MADDQIPYTSPGRDIPYTDNAIAHEARHRKQAERDRLVAEATATRRAKHRKEEDEGDAWFLKIALGEQPQTGRHFR